MMIMSRRRVVTTRSLSTKTTNNNDLVVRALYRASLRGIRALGDRSLPLQRLIKHEDWGKFQRLSAQTLDAEREALFPWADESDLGSLDSKSLLDLVRRRYRETESSVDDGFAALRAFYDLFAHLDVCSVCETRGIRVQATSRFLGVNNDTKTRVFAYRVRVANVGHPRVLQLRSRHWIVQDLINKTNVTIPKGSPGVVGQTPRLAPGTQFEYVSGTELNSNLGSIGGSFEFASDDGDVFDAIVEPFRLKVDHVHADATKLSLLDEASSEEEPLGTSQDDDNSKK